MTRLEEIERFCNHYFQHPFWDGVRKKEIDPWIRLSFLPSKYMSSTVGGKPAVRGVPSEGIIHQRELRDKLPRVVANNERGFDCYYFCNPARLDLSEKYARNEDVLRRIFLPLDLDFRLPCSVGELTGEFGLEPWAVIESSKRQGVSKHQIIYALQVEDGIGESALRELSRDLCWVFGSDPIHEPKRILRLPGTINWKGAEAGKEVSEARVISLGDIESVWEFEDLRHAVKSFESDALSRELRELGLKPVSVGGRIDDRVLKGDYGNWREALEEGRKGKWTVGEGGRHNALCTWGVQMCAARLPWESVCKNLEELRRVGFEKPYDDDRDFGRLLGGVRGKWDKIDGELDALMGEEDAAPSEEQGTVAGLENKLEAAGTSAEGQMLERCSDAAAPALQRRNTEPCSSEGEEEALNEPEVAEAALPAAPTLPRDLSTINYLVEFARRLSLRGDGESEAEYLDFLARVLAAANFYSNKKVGNISRLGQLVAGRLEWAGCARGRFYSVPLWYSGVIDHWGLLALDEDQATVLVKDLLCELSAQVVRNRKKIKDHPDVVASNAASKEPQYVFAAQGALLAQCVTDVLDRGSTHGVGGGGFGDEHILSFQNGYLELDKWGSGEIGSIDPVRALKESWHPNPAATAKCVGVRKGLSWQRFTHSIACNFDYEGAAKYLAARLEGEKWPSSSVVGLEVPKLEEFLETPFPRETEIDSWIGLLRIIGYCFLADNPIQKYFYFEGVAGGGKGTIAELILALVGGKNSARLQFSRLLSDAWLGPLEGRSVVLIDEAESADIKVHKTGVSELARVTGGDFASARKLYGDSRDIRCTQKFILTTNRGLEADDVAGQQARRVVPLNFSRKPAPGTAVDRLYARIARTEGHAVATRSVVELCLSWKFGARLFEEGLDSPSFARGKERFEEATAGVRRLLERVIIKLPSDSSMHCSSALIIQIAEIWAERKEQKHLLKGIERRITAEMEALGFEWSKNLTLPLSNAGIKAGHAVKGKGYKNCAFDLEVLLEILEMSPVEVCRALKKKSEKAEKSWFIAEATFLEAARTPFRKEHFLDASSDISWGSDEGEGGSSGQRELSNGAKESSLNY